MRVVVVLLSVAMLAACDSSAVEAKYRARQAAVDPKRLWSVELIPARAGVNAVKVCADSRITAGLDRPAVTAGDTYCKPVGDEVLKGDVRVQRCEMNGETWIATAAVRGDRKRDFVAVQSVTPAAGGPGYEQTRRYRLLGDCPEGWNIGDTTDQQGRIVKGGSPLLEMLK